MSSIEKIKYINRYGNEFTFELQEDGNILWCGDFMFCRYAMPNDYTIAYKTYLEDNCYADHCLSLNQFKDVVHEYDDETRTYSYPKYLPLIVSKKDEISMVDPSGGCYLTADMDLGDIISDNFKGMLIQEFKRHPKGYLIIIKK